MHYRSTAEAEGPVFFDRGVTDAVAFAVEQGALAESDGAARIEEITYNPTVFAFPPWQDIYRRDSERDQSYEESVRVYERVRSWYSRWGYELAEVPRGGIDERVAFILRRVEDLLGRSGPS